MHQCEYCKKTYSQKCALNRHQRTTRFCMKLQEEKGKTIDPTIFLYCGLCNREFTNKKNLVYHEKVCDRKTKKTPVEQLSSDSEKPTISITVNNTITNSNNNNTVNSMITYMSTERIQEAFKDFNLNSLLNITQKQLANMVHERLLTIPNQPPSYICTDRSRNKFYYINEHNKETEDPNATVHRTLVSKGLTPINTDIYRKERISLAYKLNKAIQDEDSELAKAYREDIAKLDESRNGLDIIKDGAEYISQLAKILPSSYDNQPSFVVLDRDKDDYDEKYFQLLLCQIGDTLIDELIKYREEYKRTNKFNGPDYLVDPTSRYHKEYLWFLQVKIERLFDYYLK